MPYIDAKGRPELVVNPAIKLGLAFFTPLPQAADTATPGAAVAGLPRPAAAGPVRRRSSTRTASTASARRSTARETTERSRNTPTVNESVVSTSRATNPDSVPVQHPVTRQPADSASPRRNSKGTAGDTRCDSREL